MTKSVMGDFVREICGGVRPWSGVGQGHVNGPTARYYCTILGNNHTSVMPYSLLWVALSAAAYVFAAIFPAKLPLCFLSTMLTSYATYACICFAVFKVL